MLSARQAAILAISAFFFAISAILFRNASTRMPIMVDVSSDIQNISGLILGWLFLSAFLVFLAFAIWFIVDVVKNWGKEAERERNLDRVLEFLERYFSDESKTGGKLKSTQMEQKNYFSEGQPS